MPSADDAKGELPRRDTLQDRTGLRLREFEACALVQIPGVAHFRAHGIDETILADGVEDRRISIDPDGVVVLSNRVQVGLIRPGAPYGLGIVKHVAQPEHAAGARAFLQRLEGRCKLARDPSGQVVHDQQVWLEDLHRAPNHAGPESDQVPVGEVRQEPGIVTPVGLPAEGWKCHTVHALGQQERTGLPRLRDHHDRRLQRGAAQRLGYRSVPPNMAKSNHSLRIQRDSGRPRLPGGERIVRTMGTVRVQRFGMGAEPDVRDQPTHPATVVSLGRGEGFLSQSRVVRATRERIPGSIVHSRPSSLPATSSRDQNAAQALSHLRTMFSFARQ